jgi:hypothetical protein
VLTNQLPHDIIVLESEVGEMKTVYFGLTDYGLWIWFTSKQAVRNCKQASEITHENIVKCHRAHGFFQIFRFYLGKEYKRG